MEDVGDNDNKANSDDDDEGGVLTIIEDSPKSKRKHLEISADELSDIGIDLELSIDQKAARSNLKKVDVKKILKQVVTNEHVLAYVRQSENPDEDVQLQFEPKLTRAKAKELFSQQPAWVSPTTAKKSHTQVLISEEIPEDESSGDEYIPGDEESDDDTVQSEDAADTSIAEPTTPLSTECGTQTTWTEDGVFKIPVAKTSEESEKLNIALRTRSKLSLSDTPLEVIEEAFIPPDITTDMYDMECDDDDWKNFLKEFTRPLDEINIGHEDEDHDPEYNILADEEIDKVDKEELRADRGVKVTRKELNNLIAELFEYADNFNTLTGQLNVPPASKPENVQPEQQVIQENAEQFQVEITVLDPDFPKIDEQQKMLLDQQMRQHVQIVTQHFLLTYKHPEYHEMSEKCYDILSDLQDKSNGNMFSHFCPLNLPQAIELADHWKERFTYEEDNEIRDHNNHVKRVISETIQAQLAGVSYIPKFSNLFMDTVSKSSIFIYPMLLPKVAFKPIKARKRHFFMDSELELLAMGLEQFIPFLKTDPFHLKWDGSVKIKDVCYYINKYMMPVKDPQRLLAHLKLARNSVDTNPVKYFLNHNETRKMVHYVQPLDVFKVVPPCDRDYDQLPQLWKEYIYPNYNRFNNTFVTPYPILPKPEIITLTQLPLYTITKVNKPPVFNKSFTKKRKSGAKRKEKKPKPPQRTKNDASNTQISGVSSIPLSHTEISGVSSIPLNHTQISGSSAILLNDTTLDERFPSNEGLLLTPPSTSTPVKCKRSLDSYFRTTPHNVSIENDKVLELKFNSSIFGRLATSGDGASPSMPTLMTPVKGNNDGTMNVEETASTSVLTIEIDEKGPECAGNVNEEGNVGNAEPKESIEDKSESAGEEVIVVEGKETETSVNSEDDTKLEKDNLDEINALMVASSTITASVKKKQTCAEKKKARMRREFKSNLRMLSEESDEAISEKTDRFVQAYFDKIKERLDLDEYHKVMEILTNFDKNKEDTTKLFKSVEEVIGKKYPDILDEFLCFFTEVQAKNIGKWLPYLIVNKMSMFLKKLELFFKDQPSQVKRIYRCLSELMATENVSMTVVKSMLLPLLKGNSLLVDMFLQIFPKEKPPDSLFNNGPWEYVQIGKDKDKSLKVEDCYESITVPEAEDPYGGQNCICACHSSSEDAGYKSRSMHCVDCGTKFMQGRLYVQTGKGLRIAKITFEDTSVDHFTRLSCPLKMKRHDSSPFKNISHANEEAKMSSDDEPDKKQQKLMKSAKRKRNPKKKPPGAKAESSKPAVETIVTPAVEAEVKKDNLPDQNNENTSDSSINEVKPQTEENMEWDCNTSIESIELKASPERVSAESESEFCEETSQDNTDSEGGSEGADSETNSPDGSCQWDRNEDKVILETFQRVEDREAAFKSIAERLEHRTMGQIRQRFEMLINLLKKLSKNS